MTDEDVRSIARLLPLREAREKVRQRIAKRLAEPGADAALADALWEELFKHPDAPWDPTRSICEDVTVAREVLGWLAGDDPIERRAIARALSKLPDWEQLFEPLDAPAVDELVRIDLAAGDSSVSLEVLIVLKGVKDPASLAKALALLEHERAWLDAPFSENNRVKIVRVFAAKVAPKTLAPLLVDVLPRAKLHEAEWAELAEVLLAKKDRAYKPALDLVAAELDAWPRALDERTRRKLTALEGRSFTTKHGLAGEQGARAKVRRAAEAKLAHEELVAQKVKGLPSDEAAVVTTLFGNIGRSVRGLKAAERAGTYSSPETLDALLWALRERYVATIIGESLQRRRAEPGFFDRLTAFLADEAKSTEGDAVERVGNLLHILREGFDALGQASLAELVRALATSHPDVIVRCEALEVLLRGQDPATSREVLAQIDEGTPFEHEMAAASVVRAVARLLAPEEARQKVERLLATQATRDPRCVKRLGELFEAESVARKAAAIKAAMRSNPALEAAIEAAPDDPAPYLAYAEWLKTQGDPRGELILVQHALASAGPATAKELAAREEALLNAHGWLGDVLEARKSVVRFGASGERPRAALAWRYGFLQAVTLAGELGEISPKFDLVKQLATVLDSPVGRFLEELSFGVHSIDAGNDDLSQSDPGAFITEYGSFVDVLVEKRPRTLRRLCLGAYVADDCPIRFSSIARVGSLGDVLPKLEKLVLRGAVERPGKLDFPELRELSIRSGGLGRKTLKAVVAATWPKLERLELWFGDHRYGGECQVKDLAPLFDAKGRGSVKHLGLMNAEFTDDIVEGLVGSKILKQLETLDLSMGCLTAAGVEHIKRHRDAFAHLTHLDLHDNAVDGDAVFKGLARVCAKVSFEGQDPRRVTGDGRRRPAVGES